MIYKWWHRFVRRRTKPIPVDQAILWKRRLSIAYGFVAWNAFGFVVYSAYKGKADWAHYYGLKTDEEKSLPPGQAWANTLGIKNAKVYRISGFQKVDEYDIVDGEHRSVKPVAIDENDEDLVE
ncbi:uncharacterized protein LOC131847691 [Achroia grisella]|uniref:uncharacterized protein LOC131847691 n=1 Tax=Achroia grisella TaxID=688607 RepID=UPI0027D28E7F|nr:uncharacterized protein LOC131847691 [Achroia grisella]